MHTALAATRRLSVTSLGVLLPLVLASSAFAADKNKGKVTASAGGGSQLEILGLASDDAEEQADALTEALRTQAGRLPDIKLGSALQPLDVMTAANKCQQAPDPACQVEIGKQLKTSQYLWGVLKKSGDAKVTVELHHYEKDKADKFVAVTYSANLRDHNDEALNQVAKRLLVELLQVQTGFVHAAGAEAMGNCSILLDGELKGPLREGSLLIETQPGEHTVTTSGCPSFQKTVVVPASGEVLVVLTEPPKTAGPVAAKKEGPGFPVQKAVGLGMVGLGIASGVVSVVFLTQYLGNQSAGNDAYKSLSSYNPDNKTGAAGDQTPKQQFDGNGAPDNVAQACSSIARSSGGGYLLAAGDPRIDICNNQSASSRNSGIAIATGVLGGTLIAGGLVLFFTAPKKEESAKPSALKNVKLQPSLGQTNGLWLSGSF